MDPEEPAQENTPPKAWDARAFGQALAAVLHGFRGEDLGLRAAALTYVSIFSLVPLVTVAVAAVDSFGAGMLREQLLVLVRGTLAPGVAQDSAAFLERFMAQASSRTAGGLGLLTLLVSATTLLHNLDASLNAIWNVHRRRALHVRAALYLAVLSLGPVMLVFWLGSTDWLARLLSHWNVPFSQTAISLTAPILSVAGFTFIYRAAPNTHVRFRAALAGGVVAGLLWEVAKRVYAQVAGHFVKANPVYGALGAAPLFLLWLYLSWLLLLLGARLAFALQSARTQDPSRLLGANPRVRELIAARLAQAISAAAMQGETAPSPRQLARQSRLPFEQVLQVLELLERAALLKRLPSGGLVPARQLGELTLADVALAVGRCTPALPPPSPPARLSGSLHTLEKLFTVSDAAGLAALQRVRWLDLLPPSTTKPAEGSPRASQKP